MKRMFIILAAALLLLALMYFIVPKDETPQRDRTSGALVLVETAGLEPATLAFSGRRSTD